MVNTAVDKMFYEFHKETLVRDSDGDGDGDGGGGCGGDSGGGGGGGGGSGKRLRDPEHVIKNTGKFMER